jgi:hypothetical protein
MDIHLLKDAKEFLNKHVRLKKEDEKHIVSVTVLTTSFWALQNVFQRSAGIIGLHGAKSFPITAGLGIMITSCSLLGSHFADIQFHKHFEKAADSFWPGLIIWNKKQSPKEFRKEYTERLCVGISVFAVLECGVFRTAFPSSVIAPGVFVNFWNVYKNSIPATGDVATASQRTKVQNLGKMFGCHQCGSRHVFTRESFIADHMPPTKFANEMNNKWWRKMFGWEVFVQY